MLADVYQETEERMDKALGVLVQELNSIRTGRANPSLVELLPIEYYGTQTPLQELAGISVPESRSLLIRPYDPSSLKNIEKAILKSDLGLTPNSDGENIRLVLPTPTEERRKELVKVVGIKAEEARIAIRNIRRDSIRDLRDFEDEKMITEDDLHRGEEHIQKITDDFIKKIDELCERKESEIMEV
ncbi:MAG TPA: ribosome recycling factor [Chloroflexi bacterium]|nr:MAG: ribosome recycling factor [Chloroflexota bacterium]HDD55855.1 ribosome recycling factor [Chloroflexota bacterium]